LVEARRVLTESGRLGLTYWGAYERMGLLPYFGAVIQHSPASHQAATTRLGDTAAVAEAMLTAAGFELTDRGTVEVVNEWPDVDTAVRALASAGPSIPAIYAIGRDAFCQALRDIVAPWHDPRLGVRVSSEFGWVTARPC
jgi:hypothetical protein